MLLLIFASAFAMNLNDRLAQIAQLASEFNNNLPADTGVTEHGSMVTAVGVTKADLMSSVDNYVDNPLYNHTTANYSADQDSGKYSSSRNQIKPSTHIPATPGSVPQARPEKVAALPDRGASTTNRKTALSAGPLPAAPLSAAPLSAAALIPQELSNETADMNMPDHEISDNEISTRDESDSEQVARIEVVTTEMPPIDFASVEKLLQQLAPAEPPSQLDLAMKRLEQDIILIQETVHRNATVAQSSGLDQFVADQAVKLGLNATEVENIIRKVFLRLAEAD
ncbi:hypothetical protein GNI_022790 [Gregarina niphandrodes]|uniref:Uncharacterized protein n=1 Tax=Gregarina niphandrodes TaxID=110365 RepID=A0A023BBT4_GRENI|nr:hypothetical protein GNI_022790 [Gregarina niphandrodes]EZG80087.1 hypothetical protein GNI_022790 [Gregarina niphandrodes]|eukprot:XP_011134336.1 hypothetical protein GNI_022790 [Gregarina niphandrodes]